MSFFLSEKSVIDDVPKKEIYRLEAAYDLFDANKDGDLDLKEI